MKKIYKLKESDKVYSGDRRNEKSWFECKKNEFHIYLSIQFLTKYLCVAGETGLIYSCVWVCSVQLVMATNRRVIGWEVTVDRNKNSSRFMAMRFEMNKLLGSAIQYANWFVSLSITALTELTHSRNFKSFGHCIIHSTDASVCCILD